MVIIAREFAVSGLRVAAGQQGVVIPASPLGKAEDGRAGGGDPRGDRDGRRGGRRCCSTCGGVTVVSGADYFLNFRRRIEEARERLIRETLARERARGAQPRLVAAASRGAGGRALDGEPLDELLARRAADVERAVERLAVDARRPRTARRPCRRAVEPLAHRRVMRECSPVASSRRSSPSSPKRSATTLCWWIVSRFSWRARRSASSPRKELARRRRGSSRARSPRRSAGGGAPSRRPRLVGALHQLVDLRAHRVLDDRSSVARRSRRRSSRGSRCAACRGRAGCAWRPGRLEDALDLVVGEAVGESRSRERAGDELLRARARGHALRLHADEPARAALGRDRRAEQRVDLLRRMPDTGAGLCSG
jgi:hypothetical protein